MEVLKFNNSPDLNNFWSKYINKLTTENIKEILALCFEGNVQVEQIRVDDEVISISGQFFEASITSSEVYEWKKLFCEKHIKPNANALYVEYMYRLFGEEYISDYFAVQFNLDRLQEQADEAKKKLSNALIGCGMAVSEYCRTHPLKGSDCCDETNKE